MISVLTNAVAGLSTPAYILIGTVIAVLVVFASVAIWTKDVGRRDTAINVLCIFLRWRDGGKGPKR
ncbi:hypothetical protein [Catenuloplanes japonicus]|uniref:hypothetical protein n=1 Tax=Catenuloplanes japonicus TaxID=33876 RepID=UPI0005268C0F|nr:hypothetical protein [Catenuloplanes japonicus]